MAIGKGKHCASDLLHASAPINPHHMRPTKLFFWLLFCGTALLFVTRASAQQASSARVAGHIVAAKVTGRVTATNLTDKTSRDLKNNDILFQNYVVATGAGASVILVFSNGATLNIGSESVLSIDEYLQDPLDKEVALADLKEEPSSSITKLNLSRGELVGNVKHLHEDKGSSFTVNTPVGAAGIRGTTFRIVFRPDSTGRVFFTLSTAEGKVLLQGATAMTTATATNAVSVDTGKEVVFNVEVKVDTTTNTVTVTTPPKMEAATNISAESKTALATASSQIADVASALIIATTQQATADAAAAKAAQDAAAAKAAADKAAAEKAAAEKEAAEKAAAEKAAAEKAAAEKAAADKAAADAKAAADKAAADAQAAADKAAADAKAAADKAAADAAASKAAAAAAKAAADAAKAANDAAKAAVDAAKAAADAAKAAINNTPPGPNTPISSTTSGDG